MKFNLLFILLFTALFTACSVKDLEHVKYEKVNHDISYTQDIKPILDKRCVSCHSCYNSPCQLKLSSYDGLQRGASKIDVYANRMSAIDPTRLFIDANSEKQWRQKGFYSVSEQLRNDDNMQTGSIMMHYLYHKTKYPKSFGTFSPETDELMCVKNQEELIDYLEENPYKGMPYGFPALTKNEYNLLQTWLDDGLKNDYVKEQKTVFETKQIKKLEGFLNDVDMKHQVTARYIYEHLFLAHITFEQKSGNFFELVRSSTPTGEPVQIIATRFPFDQPSQPFYYRFRKIDSTIVHKTHMVYEINDQKLARYKELFLYPNWELKPHMPSYNHATAANALKTFEQIPAKSRYQFLLDDIHYFIMTFIRGPVCKGQIALNVIQDHFWVMFLDPEYDVALYDKYFLHDNLENLSIPNEHGTDLGLFEMLDIYKGYEKTKNYYINKDEIYKQYFPKGLPLSSIWKGNGGNNNDAILTIYRHFDSASVHKGAWGNMPKTLWVIDYSLVERIYYSLVAGFDIFGNTAHQLLVRKYMDKLRLEGESNFLEYLPQHSRKEYFEHWYEGWDDDQLNVYTKTKQHTNIEYKTKAYKEEFVQKVLQHTGIKKDGINFIEQGYVATPILDKYTTKAQINETFKTISLPNTSDIIMHFTGSKSNLVYMRIKMNSGENLVYSVVVNRWHRNVAFMFDEQDRLDPSKDTVNFINGFVGSYPNVFVEVTQDELPQFFELVQNYDSNNPKHQALLSKFVVNRADEKFWEVFDWFDREFQREDPIHYGLFDLNRYTETALSLED